jgi:hypothetical protein
MTKESTGTYYTTFTEPAAGLSYTAYVQFVYGGNTYRIEKVLSARESIVYLGETHTSLQVAIADYLGWGRNSEGTGSSWSSETISRLGDILNSAYLQMLYPPILANEKSSHRWSFLRPAYTLTTAAEDYLYDLPSDFGSIVGDIVFDADENVDKIVRHVSPAFIDRERAGDTSAGQPTLFALRPKSVLQTAVQTTELMLYPTPDDAYDLTVYYDAKVKNLSAENPYPLGGQAVSELLVQSCRDIAAQRYRDDVAGREHGVFLERLQAAVEVDRRNAPSFLGYNHDGTCGVSRHSRHGDNFTCTLKHNLGGG